MAKINWEADKRNRKSKDLPTDAINDAPVDFREPRIPRSSELVELKKITTTIKHYLDVPNALETLSVLSKKAEDLINRHVVQTGSSAVEILNARTVLMRVDDLLNKRKSSPIRTRVRAYKHGRRSKKRRFC